jgi:RNA polymerase sigma-70 factor (ECF subfamily)
MGAFEVPTSANLVSGLSHALEHEDLHDERWLVTAAKSGCDDAFGELYRRHQLKIYRAVIRILRNQHDAEDVVQRAFQRAFINLERFREDASFLTWLTRIAINESLMLLRQRRRREIHLEDGVDEERGDGGMEITAAGPSPEEIVCETERRARLHQAIGKLRGTLKVVVFHVDLQGLTIAETAQILGVTVSAVKARLFHARRFLRKRLERTYAENGLLAMTRKSRA